ncbi:MAG TPA: multicopper oxidase domain-containing protein [Deinococcales bacterium]|nr:multicopper oxidase domain-containing protein [Deinococcales bacterium]
MNGSRVAPGEAYDTAFKAGEAGTWPFHCHELHHTENDGVGPGRLAQAIKVAAPAARLAAKGGSK